MHRAKGDRSVRASELPVCDNEFAKDDRSITLKKYLIIDSDMDQ